MRLRVAEVRKERFLSQDELAERAGVSRQALSAIELGKAVPRGSTVRKLAAALGVDPSVLVAKEPARGRK